MTALKSGTPAPDFKLSSTPDQTLSLSELRGRPVVLVFYPADWSPVCSDQLGLYNELLPEFSEFEAQIVGISVDGVWCHLAFCRDRKLHTPLLADFEPKGAVARLYGVYDEKSGEAQRALFVIDPQGVIRWSYVSPVGINPGADGILKALASIARRKKEDRMSGIRSGVNGTPCFFINGTRYDGTPDYESLVTALEEPLTRQVL